MFWKEGSFGLLLVQNSKTITGVVLAITVLSVCVSFFSRNFIRHKRILSDSINEIAPPPLQIRNILNGNVKICFSATPHTHNTKVGKQCLTVCLRLRHFISLGLMCMKNNPFHLTLSMCNHTRIWQSLYMGWGTVWGKGKRQKWRRRGRNVFSFDRGQNLKDNSAPPCSQLPLPPDHPF